MTLRPDTIRQQSAERPGTQLEGMIADLMSRLRESLRNVREIHSRVIPSQGKDQANGPPAVPVTYEQQINEAIALAGTILDLTAELNGRI